MNQLPRLVEERANLPAVVFFVIMWFLFGEVSSSSGCLGWSTLFYCGTPGALHIIILRSYVVG